MALLLLLLLVSANGATNDCCWKLQSLEKENAMLRQQLAEMSSSSVAQVLDEENFDVQKGNYEAPSREMAEPVSGNVFTLLEGNCVITEEGRCIESPNFPQRYQSSDYCSFTASGGRLMFLTPLGPSAFSRKSAGPGGPGPPPPGPGSPPPGGGGSSNKLDCGSSAAGQLVFNARQVLGLGTKICLEDETYTCNNLPLREQDDLRDFLFELGMSEQTFNASDPCTWEGVTCKWKKGLHVTQLKLESRELEGVISKKIKGLTHLNILVLRNNKLKGSIPEELGAGYYLNEVDLSFNLLNGTIPDLLFNMNLHPNRTFLDLSHNQLVGSIPTLTRFGPIRSMEDGFVRLNLGFNQLTGLVPKTLFYNPVVLSMDLSNNLLEGLEASEPGDPKTFFPNAWPLDVSNNPMNITADALMQAVLSNFDGEQSGLGSLKARNCSLYGDLTSFTYFDRSAGKYEMYNLRVVDLSFNAIERVLDAPLSSFAMVSLDSNRLRSSLPEAWWNFDGSLSLMSLSVSDNPELVAPVQPPSLPCKKLPQNHALTADPDSYIYYTKFWCSTLCKGSATYYTVDYSLNTSMLCYCADGFRGSGTDCSLCEAGSFSVRNDLSSECVRCPVNSTTADGGKSSIFACECAAGSYLEVSSKTSGECTVCPAGSFSSIPGAQGSCPLCAPGTISKSFGSTTCKECSEGYYAESAGTQTCNQCPAGTFQPSKSATACLPCPPGTNSSVAAELCSPCPPGTYQNLSGSSTCTACPLFFKTFGPGSSNRSQCICSEGTFLEAGTCQPCPDGATCIGGLSFFEVKPGYFCDKGTASSLFKCAADEVTAVTLCGGGSALSPNCIGGRIGFLCQDCPQGTYLSHKTGCIECSSNDIVVIACFVLGCFLALCFLLAGSLRPMFTRLPDRIDISCVVVQILNYIQIMSAIQSVGLHWSEPFSTLLALGNIFSIDLDVIHFGCMMKTDALGNYAFRIVLPMLAILCILVWAMLTNLLTRSYSVTYDDLINLSGRVKIAAYTSICLVSLTSFNCFSHPNQKESLVAYPSVLCWEGGVHQGMLLCSACAIILYICCLFALVTYSIWSYHTQILKDNLRFIRRYNFLFMNWFPQCYWFSAVLLSRNLLVALLPKLISSGYNQATMPLIWLVLMTYFSFIISYGPWRTWKLNYLDGSLCVVLQIVCCGGIISSRQPTLSLAISWCLFTLCISVLVAGLSFIALKVWRIFKKTKQYAFFISHHKAGGACVARFLKAVMSQRFGLPIFYDSDNLKNLEGLFDAVKNTDCLLVLLTGETLCRPWCAGEILTAFHVGIPMVPMTVGHTALHLDDFKDRFQTLSQIGFEELLDSFVVLKSYGSDLDDVIFVFNTLLEKPSLHLNLSDSDDLSSKLDILRSVSSHCRKSEWSLSLFSKDSQVSPPLDQVVQHIIRYGKKTLQAGTEADAGNVVHQTSIVSVALNQARTSQINKWLIMTDPSDVEATSAGRFIKLMLQVQFHEDVELDFELSHADFIQSIPRFGSCLFLLTSATLSSTGQLARLALMLHVSTSVSVKPVLIKDSFRFPDDSFYSQLATTTIFSTLAGEDISGRQVESALKKVFKNISVFVNVPAASEDILKASLSQLYHRFTSEHDLRRRPTEEAWMGAIVVKSRVSL